MAASHPQELSAPGRTFVAVNVLLMILTSLSVALRFLGRHIKGAVLGWDDWCILAALVINYGQTSFNLWLARHGGLGYHASAVSEEELRNMFLQLTASQFIYAIHFSLIRLSICFLFMRIFIQVWQQKTILLAIIVNLLWTLFVIISALTVCQPIAYNWNLTIPGGHCNNKVKLNTYIANAVWTILYDTTLWSLPQIIVWRLHMSKAARAGLSLIFALGIFEIAVSIIRIAFVVKVNFDDVTYDDYPAQIWTTVEINTAIIIACLPICRPVIEKILSKRFLPRSWRYTRTREDGDRILRNHSPLARGGASNQSVQTAFGGVSRDLELTSIPPTAATVELYQNRLNIENQRKDAWRLSELDGQGRVTQPQDLRLAPMV